MDGSGKKDTVKISVIVPVSDITLEPTKGMTNIVGCGKSVTSSVRYGSLYGKPTAKKGVTWSYEIVILEIDKTTGEEQVYDDSYDGELKKAKLFTQSGSKLSAGRAQIYNKNVGKLPTATADSYYDFAAVVTAKATDGSGAKDSIIYKCCPMAKRIGVYYEMDTGRDIAKTGDSLKKESILETYKIKCDLDDNSKKFIPGVKPTVVSSDTSIATAYCDDNGKLVIVSGKKTGTATLTITANDGSGVKCTFKVTVTAG